MNPSVTWWHFDIKKPKNKKQFLPFASQRKQIKLFQLYGLNSESLDQKINCIDNKIQILTLQGLEFNYLYTPTGSKLIQRNGMKLRIILSGLYLLKHHQRNGFLLEI